MFCKYCGTQISDDAVFCEKCGKEIGLKELQNVDSEDLLSNRKHYDGGLCCPVCGSNNLQAITETDVKSSGGGFSAGKGCLGYLLFGPLGLLCGTCGQSQSTSTTNRNYFVCKKCGNKFRNPQELEKEKDTLKSVGSFSIVFGIIVLVVMIIAANASNLLRYTSTGVVVFLFSLPVLLIIIGIAAYGTANEKEQELSQLKVSISASQKSSSVFDNIAKSSKPTINVKPTSNWRCRTCDTINSQIVSKCVNCGEPYIKEKKTAVNKERNYAESWTCQSCGTINSSVVTKCITCGKTKE